MPLYDKYEYEKALEDLYKKHFDKLTVYALSILHQYEIAEEVVSDVFVSIWERREDLLTDINIQAYLFRSVHNKCIWF
ncbi:MAG TPA: sigma factor [Chitinophagaceae bacterium]|nr:sigma factor [Chitinophagaceae bacterium]